MNVYRAEFTAGAAKEIKKLDRPQAERIQRFLLDRARHPHGRPDPRVVGKALVGQPFWRHRVGDIRILARIDDAVYLVLVVEIGRRDQIYRR